MLMDAEIYKNYKDEIERPTPPKLRHVGSAKVHWLDRSGNYDQALLFFYDASGEYRGSLWVKMSEIPGCTRQEFRQLFAEGRTVDGFRPDGFVTFDQFVRESAWARLHMTREQCDEFTKGWTLERREAWQNRLHDERVRWQIGLEFE